MTRNEQEMIAALNAVLLFHSGSWSPDKQAAWEALTGTSEATTKNLCDAVRAALPVISADT